MPWKALQLQHLLQGVRVRQSAASWLASECEDVKLGRLTQDASKQDYFNYQVVRAGSRIFLQLSDFEFPENIYPRSLTPVA